MEKKVLTTIAIIAMLLCINSVAYADEINLKSETYKIAEYEGKKYIQGITPQTTIEGIADNLNCNKQMKYYDEAEQIVSNDDNAKTGMYVQIENEKYYIVVGLDINKDGNITTTDMRKLCWHMVENELLEGISFLAGDINVDGQITTTDVLRSKITLVEIIDKEDMFFDKGENDEFEYNINLATKNAEIVSIRNREDWTLVIPEEIEGKKVYSLKCKPTEKHHTFTEIELPKSISKIDLETLTNFPQLETISVSEENDIFASQDGVLFNKNKTELLLYPPYKRTDSYKVPDSVTTIKANAFANLGNLEMLTIGDNVKTIEPNAIPDWGGTICAEDNTAAMKYAKENNITCDIPDKGMEVENTGVFVIPPVDPAKTQIKGRYNPENNVGIDIGGDQGEKVVAVMSGTVGGVDEKKGSVVIISKNHMVQIFFIHMDNIRVKDGDVVKQGDWVGEIGRHGLASEAYSRVDYGLSVLVDGVYEHRNPTPYTGH